MDITYHPIGIIRSPFKTLDAMPIQPVGEARGSGTVEVFGSFAAGLKDLEGFSYVILLYHFHAVREFALTVTPFLASQPHGIFATRAPKRPNPIGLSVVQLVSVTGSTLQVAGLDILDETPLLDLKPYVPEFDHRPGARIGWLERVIGQVQRTLSDKRFT